jgi:hypothetical protein
MSSAKQVKNGKVGVRFNKATGAPYADMREVIESELERIRRKRANTTDACSKEQATNSQPHNGRGHRKE